MPKFGDYASGGVGQSTDTLLVKRGTSTVRTTLDELPIPAAVAASIGSKVAQTQFDTTIAELDADIQQGLATKQDVLNFYGRIQKTGNNVTVDPFISAGTILDGRSSYCVATTSTSFGNFPSLVTAPTTSGTVSGGGPGTPGNPTNYWESLGRAIITSAAAINSAARVSYGPRVRFPVSETALYGGFRSRFVYCDGDAVTGAGAVGCFQTNPTTGGVAPTSYTGGRVMFYHDKADTNWKFTVNGSYNIDLGASFPCNGTRTNAYIFDITATPAPNWGITWRAYNIHTGAESTGTYTGTFSGGFAVNFTMLKDTMDGTTAVVFETIGMATGAWVEAIMGEPAPVVGNTITASQTITRVPYANAENAVNSATPVTLTIANSGFSDRDYFYGTNIGAGAVSFAGDGFTIQKDANVAATVEQYQSFSLQYINGVWVRLS